MMENGALNQMLKTKRNSLRVSSVNNLSNLLALDNNDSSSNHHHSATTATSRDSSYSNNNEIIKSPAGTNLTKIFVRSPEPASAIEPVKQLFKTSTSASSLLIRPNNSSDIN